MSEKPKIVIVGFTAQQNDVGNLWRQVVEQLIEDEQLNPHTRCMVYAGVWKLLLVEKLVEAGQQPREIVLLADFLYQETATVDAEEVAPLLFNAFPSLKSIKLYLPRPTGWGVGMEEVREAR